MKRIWINGVEYGGAEEMPPEVRREYERALAGMEGDEARDLVEPVLGAAAGPADSTTEIRTSFTEIVVNGRKYSSWEEVPPESREIFHRLMEDVPRSLELPVDGPRGDATPRPRGPKPPPPPRREIRIQVSGGVGWLIALILALALLGVLVFGR